MIPEDAQAILDLIPSDFVDDGCSCSPDSLMGTDIKWACRIHDWRYCTRAHRPGRMTTDYRKKADRELRGNLRAGMPWYSQWTRVLYYWAVRRWGSGDNSFDSCGPAAGSYCRHGMAQPPWMLAEAALDTWNQTLEDV